MENAVQALKMGAAILVFSLALAVVFMYFSQAKEVSDIVFYSMDMDSDMEYIKADKNATKRIVGIENIIPTIYRAQEDAYVVKVENTNGSLIIGYNPNQYEDVGFETKSQSASQLSEEVKNIMHKLVKSYSMNKFEEKIEQRQYANTTTYQDPITGEVIQSVNARDKKITIITYRITN